jgi:hypothetical protein
MYESYHMDLDKLHLATIIKIQEAGNLLELKDKLLIIQELGYHGILKNAKIDKF